MATPVEDDGGVVDGAGGSLPDSLVYISCIFSSQNCVHIGGGLKEDWSLPTRGKIHGELFSPMLRYNVEVLSLC